MVFLGEITPAGLHLHCGLCSVAMDIVEHKHIVPYMIYVMQFEPYGPLCFECEGINADLVPPALNGHTALNDGKQNQLVLV